MDGPTDGGTDKAAYRVACTRPKMSRSMAGHAFTKFPFQQPEARFEIREQSFANCGEIISVNSSSVESSLEIIGKIRGVAGSLVKDVQSPLKTFEYQPKGPLAQPGLRANWINSE